MRLREGSRLTTLSSLSISLKLSCPLAIDEEYDVIVLGIRLKECILSALLSVDGVKLWKRFRGNDKPPAHLGSSRDYNVDMIPKMEQLNAELYAKYQNLKMKGFEDDEWFHKLESDLRKSKLATEDMIGDQKNAK